MDSEALTYIRGKVDAVLSRPEFGRVSGRVTITKDVAHHVLLPWAAGAEIRVGGGPLVVVHAREADARRLADRLRAQAERAMHRAGTKRRSARPPPWRGGTTDHGGDSPAA
ncbi:hypothetical protein [Streptomyces sp. NPDC058891]|uniref:hypothetical protein n=1 Tax=Streptomyces sp. NPDC058891 TaxID=3346667 RepID=UPI003680AECD